MCGIAGIIGKKTEAREKALADMVEVITHRGPDDDGFFSDEKVVLGMRRLSIIDLAHGKQPISSEDNRFLIIFNGEIYNYKELRAELENSGHHFKTESDTEVVLRMYELYGGESLAKLRGMFAFAIYDKEEKKVFLARDFFGIKPLYYLKREKSEIPSPAHSHRGTFATDSISSFSSEMKSFLALPDFKLEVNDEAVFNYLSYQYNPLEETFLKGVYKLPPAHYMEIESDGSFKIKKYWQFKFEQNAALKKNETAKKILETMKNSVAHHMIADVPVGSFLSGGIDSSIIVTLMQNLVNLPHFSSNRVKTFTVTFGDVSEGAEAKETAEPLGTEHYEVKVGAEEYFSILPDAVWHFDEPVADPSAIGIYFLAREARKHVKVVLSGEGADELFGGYNIYLEPFARKKVAWIPKFLLKPFLRLPFEFKGKNFLRRILTPLKDRYIGNAKIFEDREINNLWKGQRVEKYSLKNLYNEVKNLSDSTKMQYVDINTWLIGDILAKADKMTMAHSLELRVPFLDTQVAQVASVLPDKFKWRSGETKSLLREAFRGLLPESTRKRPKLGFPTPVRKWFRNENLEAFETIYKNEYLKSHFNIDVVKGLIQGHTSGRQDNSRKIYLLLMLALWYNKFIKNGSH